MEKKDVQKLKWPIIGNNHIAFFFDRLLAKKNVQGNFLISGPDNIGKTSVSLFFVKVLLCAEDGDAPCGKCSSCLNIEKYITRESTSDYLMHSDIKVLERGEDKKNISIEQIRGFIKALNMSSFLNSYKIGIVRDADMLSIEASNALLKTLEEPKSKVLIFLITSHIEKLPKTVVSRCQVLNFHPVSSKLIYDYLIDNLKASRDDAKKISHLCFGRPALATKYLDDKENFSKYLKDIQIFIDFFSSNITSRLKSLDSELNIGTGQAAVHKAKKVLNNWQGVLRDMLLHEVGQLSLVYNVDIEKISVRSGEKNGVRYLLDVNTAINKSINFIDANVNPKIVLNNLALSI